MVEMLSTYYVYDVYGNLCFVLPPGANPDANAVIPQAMLNSLCYQYQYDSRNRQVAKALPGKQWESVIYNTLDQPVASQDGNQQSRNEWTIIKYDVQGRQIMTGIWNNGNTAISPQALQAQVNSQTNLWESTTNSGYGYTNNAWPQSSITQVLTVGYYDTYNNIPGLPANFTPPANVSSKTVGLVTASQTNVLGTSDMLWTVNYFDDKGRAITSYKQNYFGGTVSTGNYDQVNTTYSFTDQITTVTRIHFNTSSAGTPVVTIKNKFIFDQAGRKINNWQQMQNRSNLADVWTLVSQNAYNEVGQRIGKNLHNNTDSTIFYQQVAYSYNERGWLIASVAPLFTEQLQYNTNSLSIANFNAQFNGNISGEARSTPTLSNVTTTYTYDRLNRLTSGVASDGNSEQGIVYDQMGNITALQRTGNENDNLTYSYLNGGLSNQLGAITNIAGGNSGLANGITTYSNYDANGNSTYDGHNATGVTYNMLNLPQSITAKNITYVYDASGHKLRRLNAGVATEYLDGIEYDAGNLTFIQTEEGQALPNGAIAYNYEYNLTDHLGNMRVMFDTGNGTAQPQQQNDYYPFGLNRQHNAGTTPNKYLYNNKELQDGLNQYDYGARFYDPVIARWNSVDPLAQTSTRWSPYSYASDNPVRNIDPDGMSTESWMEAHGLTSDDLINVYTAPQENQPASDNSEPSANLNGPNATGTTAGQLPDKADNTTTVDDSNGNVETNEVSKGDDPIGLKALIALAAGEAAGNPKAARAIVSTILNRLDKAGADLSDPNWLAESIHIKGLGGTVDGNYQIYKYNKTHKKPQYEFHEVDKLTIEEIRASTLPYIVAALQAYDNRETMDYSNGAISWSATPQSPKERKKDNNFKRVDAGIFVITIIAGNTTFFKFK